MSQQAFKYRNPTSPLGDRWFRGRSLSTSLFHPTFPTLPIPKGMGFTHPLIPSRGLWHPPRRVVGWPVFDIRPIFFRSIFGSNFGPPSDGRPSLLRTVWNPSWAAPVKNKRIGGPKWAPKWGQKWVPKRFPCDT